MAARSAEQMDVLRLNGAVIVGAALLQANGFQAMGCWTQATRAGRAWRPVAGRVGFQRSDGPCLTPGSLVSWAPLGPNGFEAP